MALKARLADFLAITPSFAAEPKLLSICRSYRELGAGAAAGAGGGATPHPVADARKDMQALKQRLIDSELRAVEAKQGSATREAAILRGGTEALDVALDCLSRMEVQAATDSGTLRTLQRRIADAQQRLGVPQTQFVHSASRVPDARGGGADALGSTMTMLAALDYPSIKRAMVDGQRDAPLMMQALRWRLTKAPRRQRRNALLQFIQNDLLDMDVMGAVLISDGDPNMRPDVEAREQGLRLINLFASEPSGRTYLLSQPALIPKLCELMMSDDVDTVARQNALGSLQKLSLRRQPQNAMIDCDVISWLVTVCARVPVRSGTTTS